jgi:hypothetical protein
MDFSGRNGSIAAFTATILPLLALSACNGPADGGAPDPSLNGRSPSGNASVTVGSSCSDPADPDRICLAIKYISYVDSSGKPVSSAEGAIRNIEETNRIWAQCGIKFQIDSYEAVDPGQHGLAYGGLQAEAQQNDIRSTFSDDETLLVVTTGPWNTTKNGWARSPNDAPYGAILDGGIANGYPEIYAHEIGHYLNLDHVDGDPGNLMYYSISKAPATLSDSQCAETRRIATGYWTRMLR